MELVKLYFAKVKNKILHTFRRYFSKILNTFHRLTGSESQVFYINGSETLPPPLSKTEEAKIMERIEAGDLLIVFVCTRDIRKVERLLT